MQWTFQFIQEYSEKLQLLLYLVDASGIHATKEKLKAIQAVRSPAVAVQSRSYFGLLNYYSRYINTYTQLLQK